MYDNWGAHRSAMEVASVKYFQLLMLLTCLVVVLDGCGGGGSSSGAPTGDDVGDTWQTATAVAPSADIISGNQIEPKEDVDYFSFELVADTGYRITTIPPYGDRSVDTALTLYDVDGVTQLDYNDDGGDGDDLFYSLMTYKPTVSGTYFVKVESTNNNYAGAYYLQVADAEDIAAIAESLSVGGPSSSTYTDEDNDYWFVFSAVAGNDYTANINNTTCVSGDQSNLWLEVYEPDLITFVGFDKEMQDGSCASFSFTAAETGTYVILVRQNGEPLYSFDVNVTSP